MAQIPYRANLTAAQFPFLARDWGRSIIVPGADQNFDRTVVSGADTDKDKGIPQVYYMHNVMPYAQGLQSVGYISVVSGVAGQNNFLKTFPLRDDSAAAYNTFGGISQDLTTGAYQLWTIQAGTWVPSGPQVPNSRLSIAHVNGKTFVYFAGWGCIRYDFPTATWVTVTLSGLTASAILGITSCAGYVLAWSLNSLYWSSTLPIVSDIIDFVPSLITGAGGQSIEQVRGQITFCGPHQLGIMIYSTQNAVMGVASSNALYPFSFRELVASGGVADDSMMAYDSNTNNHYVYTTEGLQIFSTNNSQVTLPEVTDFIAGSTFEDYSSLNHQFSYVDLTGSTMQKKITGISSRYLVVSYGVSSFTHAIVYDYVMKRWGKLKVSHVDCFEYEMQNSLIREIPKQNMAFLMPTGEIKLLDFEQSVASQDSVMLCGRYQYVRSRNLILDEVVFDSVLPDNTFGITALSCLNGSDISSYEAGYLSESGSKHRRYNFRSEGENISLEITGTFRADSLALKFHPGAKR
jgi:hypothetical protein